MTYMRPFKLRHGFYLHKSWTTIYTLTYWPLEDVVLVQKFNLRINVKGKVYEFMWNHSYVNDSAYLL